MGESSVSRPGGEAGGLEIETRPLSQISAAALHF